MGVSTALRIIRKIATPVPDVHSRVAEDADINLTSEDKTKIVCADIIPLKLVPLTDLSLV
jgi:hypothetical protein